MTTLIDSTAPYINVHKQEFDQVDGESTTEFDDDDEFEKWTDDEENE